MRIVDKVHFTLGIFDIVVGIGLTIASIVLHRYTRIVFTLLADESETYRIYLDR